MKPLVVNDNIPKEAEIEISMLGLKGRRGGSGGHAREETERVATGG